MKKYEKIQCLVLSLIIFYILGIVVGSVLIEIIFSVDMSVVPVWSGAGILFGCWCGQVAIFTRQIINWLKK